MAKAKAKAEAPKSETVLKLSGMTAVLVYDLETNAEDFEIAQNAGNMASALFDIQQEIYRPSYKHGYKDPEINDIISKINAALEKSECLDADGEKLRAESLIAALMKKHHEILEYHNVRRG